MGAGREHRYRTELVWTGNAGTGTSSYRGYQRAHEIRAPGKPVLLGSSDPAFRGDASRYNPEELLLASVSACHMLWYLHVASEAGVVVTAYEDAATGTMVEEADGGGRFTEVVLKPVVTISSGDPEAAKRAHEDAHRLCYIARSVNFPIRHEPRVLLA